MTMFNFELTDTFGGEANYAWVKRTTVEVPDGTSDKLVVMLAKEWAGWSGERCETEKCGDAITIRPRRCAQVLFVQYVETPLVTLDDIRRWAELPSDRPHEQAVAKAILAALPATRNELVA